ncbi:hypothetical protein DMA11_07915 [Marinilabiliaceae bacterium JC017]|nr:hypothetical protein DMA11_07915 [Marinilabiliaceae bacterium JC017]
MAIVTNLLSVSSVLLSGDCHHTLFDALLMLIDALPMTIVPLLLLVGWLLTLFDSLLMHFDSLPMTSATLLLPDVANLLSGVSRLLHIVSMQSPAFSLLRLIYSDLLRDVVNLIYKVAGLCADSRHIIRQSYWRVRQIRGIISYYCNLLDLTLYLSSPGPIYFLPIRQKK